MKTLRKLGLVAVALSLTACVNLQCAAGNKISQIHTPSPLEGMIGVLIAGGLFVLCLAFLASDGGGLGRR